jgi:hypothetical protein
MGFHYFPRVLNVPAAHAHGQRLPLTSEVEAEPLNLCHLPWEERKEIICWGGAYRLKKLC